MEDTRHIQMLLDAAQKNADRVTEGVMARYWRSRALRHEETLRAGENKAKNAQPSK